MESQHRNRRNNMTRRITILGEGIRDYTPEEEATANQLQAEYDALAWKRSRETEYPSIADLVVALYDTDDKSAIEAKRASVKAKYPKP